MKRELYDAIKEESIELLNKANIVVTQKEKDDMELVDFGMDDPRTLGIQIVVYVNTELCCAKEMCLLPNQTCAEHIHKPLPEIGYFGKEETFRCRYGECHLFIPGEKTESPSVNPPEGMEEYFTCCHEIVLHPGDQYTMVPDTLHWFKAGHEGAVISEFSTKSMDEYDMFTDPRIDRSSAVRE